MNVHEHQKDLAAAGATAGLPSSVFPYCTLQTDFAKAGASTARVQQLGVHRLYG